MSRNSSGPPTARNYRNLDLLRAVAILLVFVCHTILFLHFNQGSDALANGLGRFGVLLFFFHTSFVLTQSLDISDPQSNRWTLKFYIRRAFRIYPLAIFMVIVAVASAIPCAPWDLAWHSNRNAPTVIANLLLIHNLVGKSPVIAPLWSLPIEVQMYAVLPLLFKLLNHSNWRHKLALCLAVVAALAGLVFMAVGHLNTLAFIPCFLSGIFAYKITKETPPAWRSSLWLLAIIAATVAGTFLTLDIPAEWGVCLSLAWIFPKFIDMRSTWFSEMCKSVAKYSYGIYLSHTFALWISFTLLENRLRSPLLAMLVAVVITAIASVASYHLIEHPFMQLGRRFSSHFARKERIETSLSLVA